MLVVRRIGFGARSAGRASVACWAAVECKNQQERGGPHMPPRCSLSRRTLPLGVPPPRPRRGSGWGAACDYRRPVAHWMGGRWRVRGHAGRAGPSTCCTYCSTAFDLRNHKPVGARSQASQPCAGRAASISA